VARAGSGSSKRILMGREREGEKERERRRERRREEREKVREIERERGRERGSEGERVSMRPLRWLGLAQGRSTEF
jgi:hypothetical protein